MLKLFQFSAHILLTVLAIVLLFSISSFSNHQPAKPEKPALRQLLSASDIHASSRYPIRDDTNIAQASCQIEGNQDLYGIGIRVGFYLQVTASTISILFRPTDAK